jgi:hypothetical protein
VSEGGRKREQEKPGVKEQEKKNKNGEVSSAMQERMNA